MTILILFGVFAALLAIGMPIAFAIGIASAAAAINIFVIDNVTIVQRMLVGINSFPLLAVIFFVFTGVLMAKGGVALRLVRLSEVVVGRLPGGLAQITVLSSMLFGGVSGSAVAEVTSIGATLIPGAAAPKLIRRAHLSEMKRGAVIADVAIDQGGCAETSRPTTHDEPTYVVDGVVHYCVANMPGAVANTSTFALNNATLPFVLALAGKGYKKACLDNPHLLAGLNVHRGQITHEAVARDLNLPYTPPEQALAAA